MTINNMVIKKEKIPALRVAVTRDCNLKCSYCPPHGENYSDVNKLLNEDDLGKALNAAREIGIKSYKLTGGEPLFDIARLEFILGHLSKMDDVDVTVTTNGINLEANVDFLLSKRVSQIKVSLDTLDKEKYVTICGVDGLENVIGGIKASVSRGLLTRVNMLVMKNNYHEVPDMIRFCKENKVDLKLLDLNYYADVGEGYWNDHYVHLFVKKKGRGKNSLIKKLLLETTASYTVGGYGIPMGVFKIGGIRVIIKDSKRGAQYGPICHDCYLLPQKSFVHYCQEGIYDLTLTADGKLKICKHRPDLGISIKGLNEKEMKDKFVYVIKNYFPAAGRHEDISEILSAFEAPAYSIIEGEYKSEHRDNNSVETEIRKRKVFKKEMERTTSSLQSVK